MGDCKSITFSHALQRFKKTRSIGQQQRPWRLDQFSKTVSILFQSYELVGFNVRLVGQDVQRGTFSQRHFVFHDQQSGDTVTPLAANPNKLTVVNSHLSEAAVLGFEYGLSVANSSTLPIWEAQFGDFFNGAQIIFDAFISSGQTKWGLQSGLVMLLPHGYDGTGPEHSSCRMERFLQMSNAPHDATTQFSPNWHVVHPTTPANYFHLLRRQMENPHRKPLIVVSPKTLLRLPAAVSSISELANGKFQPLYEDPRNPTNVSKLVLCSGKFYYEIEKERASRGIEDMAIVRIEELCPLPSKEIALLLQKYPKAKTIWCQEEHRNMGPYDYTAPRLQSLMNRPLEYVGREVSAAPAAGYSQLHKSELSDIWKTLFANM
jgi:probable 2-oxoglutarate dehydrogenase E1 component DHKTD1